MDLKLALGRELSSSSRRVARAASPLTLRYNRCIMRRLGAGSRGSALALRQTALVVDALKMAAPEVDLETLTFKTEGDRRPDAGLEEIGGQGVFVKDIEGALLGGEIDLAVHSLKDMPAETPASLTIGAVLERGDPRDALVS